MKVIFYENVAVVTVGDHLDGQDKDAISSIRRSDRRFDPLYKRWIVRNPHRYLHIPEFYSASQERGSQMDFLAALDRLEALRRVSGWIKLM
jgi:hypothetical protein